MSEDVSMQLVSPTFYPNNHHGNSNNQSDHETTEDPPPYNNIDEALPPYSPSFTRNRLFDIPEAPPDYFSVVASRIQDARRETDDTHTCTCTLITKAFQIILYIFAISFVFLILISFPVTMLGVGSAYYGQCSIEPLIPIYLIAAGICGMIKSAETVTKHFMVCFKCSCLRTWKRHKKLKYLLLVWNIIDAVFNVMLFGLFIAGSYWIFHVYDDLQNHNFPSNMCHPVLYKFSFGVMISSYIIFGLTCCCVCGCTLCRASPDEVDRHRESSRRRENGDREVNGGEILHTDENEMTDFDVESQVERTSNSDQVSEESHEFNNVSGSENVDDDVDVSRYENVDNNVDVSRYENVDDDVDVSRYENVDVDLDSGCET